MRQNIIFTAITLAFFALLAHRIWQATRTSPASDASSLTLAEERQLYFTAGGAYSRADIAANGRLTPTQKYRGLRTRHDLNPRPGDAICPITRTKADRDCTWIVSGHTFSFCCPPCIDEFVRRAKESPAAVGSPADFVQERESHFSFTLEGE